MEGLIFDIKKFSINDGPGIRTTVFFKGCPLRCTWCHNPESQECYKETIETSHKLDEKIYNLQATVGNNLTTDEVMIEIMKDEIFYEESGGGITFSGGEPTMQPDFLKQIAKECKDKNIHTALDTSGFVNQSVFSEILPHIDLYLFDLKLVNNELHQKFTGLSNQLIIENLMFLSAKHSDIIIRIPVIPGITDTEENITDISNLLSDLPSMVKEVHLLPYHRIASNKYLRLAKSNLFNDIKSLNKEDVIEHKTFFEAKGFKVKIGG